MKRKNITIILAAIVLLSGVILGIWAITNNSQRQSTTFSSTDIAVNSDLDENENEIESDSNSIDENNNDSSTDINAATDSETINESSESESPAYANGIYFSSGSYTSPAGAEGINVEIILENGRVSSVEVRPMATDLDSIRYQEKFSAGIASIVVGKPITEAYVNGRVNGSSLTGEGFNEAIDSIIAQSKV